MKDGFIKVAASTVKVGVADIKSNIAFIKNQIDTADKLDAQLLVLPELCLTGYTCGDLFLSETLISEALEGLKELCEFTAGKSPVVTVGLPFKNRGRLFNCVAVLFDGAILGIIPKNYLDYSPAPFESRSFSCGGECEDILICGQIVPFGSNIVFRCEELPEFCFGVTIGKHFTKVRNNAEGLCESGASIIANSAALNELPESADNRRLLVTSISNELSCGFIYADADSSESTTDIVFSRHLLIAENGKILKENLPFGEDDLIVSEIDVKNVLGRRIKNSVDNETFSDCETVYFSYEKRETELTRDFDRNPFVPSGKQKLSATLDTVLNVQSYGLKKRVMHTHCKTLVLGISGGLDSTLALLVAVRTLKLLNRPLTDILAVTMPCFGTTSRTK